MKLPKTHHLRTSYIPDLVLHTNNAGRRVQNGFAHPIQFLWFNLHHKSEAVPRNWFLKKQQQGDFLREGFLCAHVNEIWPTFMLRLAASFSCLGLLSNSLKYLLLPYEIVDSSP